MRDAVEHAAATFGSGAEAHAFRFVRAPRNGGKGSAIRLGWRHADPAADWLGWVDADGAVSAARDRARDRAAPRARRGRATSSARASRWRAGTCAAACSVTSQGRVFATLTEAWLRLGVYDTQCGLKLIRASRLRPLLPRLREDGWMLDVEVLAWLNADGARVVELPIDWVDVGRSKIRFGIDPLRMLRALAHIRAPGGCVSLTRGGPRPPASHPAMATPCRCAGFGWS